MSDSLLVDPVPGPETESAPPLPGRSVRRGTSAIEYAAVLSLIAVAVVGAAQFLGGAASSTYDTTGKAVKSSQNSSKKKTTTTKKKPPRATN